MFVDLMAADYILRKWKEMPNRPRRTYDMISNWREGPDAGKPLTARDVSYYKELLKRNMPTRFAELFPEESGESSPTD